jgi:hypothetical protein
MNKGQKSNWFRKLRKESATEALTRDMLKWEETLEEGRNDPKKIRALKRMLLLLGSCDLEISENGKDFIKASENKLPASEWLSGRLGRVYMSLPAGYGESTLRWIAGGAHRIDDNRVAYPRFAATHAGMVGEDGKVSEKKLNPISAGFGGLYSLGKSLLFGDPRNHYGMDVAFGGVGNRYESASERDGNAGIILDNGTGGHVYFNLNKGKNGDSLGFGLEGTAPAKSGFLGKHSFFGSPDDFTPFEGDKFAVKFEAKYLDELFPERGPARIKSSKVIPIDYDIVDQNPEEQLGHEKNAAKSLLMGHVKYSKFNPFSKHRKLDDDALQLCCETLGIKLVNNNAQILTPIGKKLDDLGVHLPCNYNGARLNISQKQFVQIIQISDSEIDKLPSRMVHWKPRPSVEEFMAQADYFNRANKRDLFGDDLIKDKQDDMTNIDVMGIGDDGLTLRDTNIAVRPTTSPSTNESNYEKMVKLRQELGV